MCGGGGGGGGGGVWAFCEMEEEEGGVGGDGGLGGGLESISGIHGGNSIHVPLARRWIGGVTSPVGKSIVSRIFVGGAGGGGILW